MSIPEKMPRMPTHDRLMDATWSACHTSLSAARRGDGAEAAERIVRRNGRNRGSRSPIGDPPAAGLPGAERGRLCYDGSRAARRPMSPPPCPGIGRRGHDGGAREGHLVTGPEADQWLSRSRAS